MPLEVKLVTVWSSRLGKIPKTCIFDYGKFFTDFQNNTFLDFFERFFFKSSELLAKMVKYILFYQNMVAQIQYNFISPFCDKNVSRLLRTSGFNVKISKLNLTVFCSVFTISK